MIFVYLLMVRVLFVICRLFSIKNKRTVFVVSFGDNAAYVIRELLHETAEEIIILREPSCREHFLESERVKELSFTMSRPLQFIRSFFYLATARTIFFDNYFGFLASVSFPKEVRRIQLWHAAGAIKQFGMQDASNEYRSKRAMKRFQKVYHSFSHVVVGSDKMGTVFQESFGTDSFNIVPTGIPRTDFFFDEDAKERAIQKLKTELPMLESKQVILYAPTYRDNELSIDSIPLEIEKLEETFGEDSLLLLKLHPAVTDCMNIPESDFIYNISSNIQLNDILLLTDILITDYSSIPFEFALLNRPMIFYAYDLKTYEKERGLIENYQDFVPGPIAKSTDEIIEFIEEKQFSYDEIQRFSDEWNTYSNGQSSRALIEYLYKEAKAKQKQKIR